jgi:DNA-binding HxlR family transcriptional regulator
VKRSYGDACGIARALDVVGERWALLVIRELLLGPKRFSDLRAGLRGISPDVLSQRLRELEQAGLLRRAELPPPAGSRVYQLTDRGKDLEPVIVALGRWGTAAPFPPGDAKLGVDSMVLALKTVFDPGAADDLDAIYELRLDQQPFSASVAGGRLDIAHGSAVAPDATIEADPATLPEILWRGRRLSDAERAGEIRIEGDRQAAKRFLSLFQLAGT